MLWTGAHHLRGQSHPGREGGAGSQNLLDSAYGSDAGELVFPGRVYLCSGICAHVCGPVVQRTLDGWEVLRLPFGPWAFASAQISIEDDGAGSNLLGPLLKGPGLLWLQGWAQVPWEAPCLPSTLGSRSCCQELTQEAAGARTLCPPPGETSPSRGKGCESLSAGLPRQGWRRRLRRPRAWLQAGPKWAVEGQWVPWHPGQSADTQPSMDNWCPLSPPCEKWGRRAPSTG